MYIGLGGHLGFLGVGARKAPGVIQNQPRDRLRVPASVVLLRRMPMGLGGTLNPVEY